MRIGSSGVYDSIDFVAKALTAEPRFIPSMTFSLTCPTRATWMILLLGSLAAGSCNTVEFYEMEHFGDSVMNLDDGPAEAHFHQKIYYSMEGSAGGIGTTAGGGCGCY